MSALVLQILLFAFSGIFIITGIFSLAKANTERIKIIAVFASGIVFAILGTIQSHAVREVPAMKNGIEQSQHVHENREIALEYFKNPLGILPAEEKERLIAKALDRSSEERSPEDYLVLSIETWLKEQYDESLELAYTALNLKPESKRVKAALFASIGDNFLKLKCNDLAITYYKKAINEDESFPVPHNSLGNIYRDQKKHGEAESEYKKAIELTAKDTHDCSNVSVLCKTQIRNAAATEAYKKSMMLDPKRSNVHYNLGLLYESLGRQAEAEQEFKKAYDPNISQ